MSRGRAQAQRQSAHHKQHPKTGLLDQIVEQMGSPTFGQRIERSLPKTSGLEPRRFVELALSSIAQERAITECTAASIEKAVLQAAALGLEIGGSRQHAAIVPFWDGTAKAKLAQLLPMYKGRIYLAVRCGAIKDAFARVVFDGDHFEFEETDAGTRLVHRRAWATTDAQKITHVYAVGVLPDGTRKIDVMHREEVEYIRTTFSKQATGDMWTKSWGEAGKKTVIHRMLKTVPIGADPDSRRFADAMELVGRAETGIIGGALSTETMEEIIAQSAARMAAERSERRADPEPDPREAILRRAMELAEVGPQEINQTLLRYANRLDHLESYIEKNRPGQLNQARNEARIAAEAGQLEPENDDSEVAAATAPLNLFGD